MTTIESSAGPRLVLIVDDQEWTARSMESILAPNGYAVVRARTGAQALGIARTAQLDAVILDVHLPDISGIEVCRRLAERSADAPALPVVMTSSTTLAREERLALYEAHAWDICTQPIDAEVLLLKLATFTDAKRALDRSREESLFDKDTGLYSARGLRRRVQELGAVAARSRVSLSCIAFSAAPETAYSPAADGEEEMRIVAGRLADVCRRVGRASDVIGRLGPSDFGVVATGLDEDGVLRLVERLGDEMARAEDGRPALRLRAGYCAIANVAEGIVEPEEALQRASAALREVRTSGAVPAVRSFDELPLSFDR